MLIDIGAEEPANERKVADDRCAVFSLLHILADQSAEHNGLAVPNAHAGGHFTRAEDRLVYHVVSEKDVGGG